MKLQFSHILIFFELLIVLQVLSSCTTTQTVKTANYTLIPKEVSTNNVSVLISPNTGRDDGLCFTLTNMSNEPVAVDWDKSYLVINGETLRCIHAGIRFMEKSAPQALTPIAPHSKISDCLFPIKNIELREIYEGWIQKPLGANYGEYSIAIIINGKQENLQGSFNMDVIRVETPVNNLSSTESAYNFYLIASAIALLITNFSLFAL